MVKSKIYPTKINYNENKQLDKEDIKHTGVDMLVAYCTPKESLEHLCFR